MNYITLRSVKIQGFRSFKDEANFLFPEKGAVLINGKYSDSSVSSGSGKSSVLIAIAYALGFSALPATELKNWDSKKLYVEVVLWEGDKIYTIIRSPKLSVRIYDTKEDWNEVYEGTVAEEKLAEILRLNADLAEVLTYRQQRKQGKFLNFTDSQKKEFLSSLLGLTKIEDATDSLAKELTNLESSKDLSIKNLEFAKNMISGMDQVTDEQIYTAEQEVSMYTARLKELSNTDTEKYLNQQILSLNDEKKKTIDVIQKVDRCKIECVNIRSQILNIQSDIATLKQSMCPTCKREWDNNQKLLADKEEMLKNYLAKMQTNIEIERNAKPIIENLPILEEKIKKAYEELGSINAPKKDAQNAKALADSKLLNLINKKNQYIKSYQSIESLVSTIDSAEKDIKIVKHAMELLGRNGFLGVIFDEILYDIEARANDMLSQIPNVSRFTLNISSTATSKTGNTKKSISTSIYKDGQEINLKNLSGGQMCALELCTDLAVSEAIRSRSGSNLGWIALDEAMDGLDAETKASALEVIKSKIKGLILLVDHATEIKEGFESIINIEFDGKYSRVV